MKNVWKFDRDASNLKLGQKNFLDLPCFIYDDEFSTSNLISILKHLTILFEVYVTSLLTLMLYIGIGGN